MFRGVCTRKVGGLGRHISGSLLVVNSRSRVGIGDFTLVHATDCLPPPGRPLSRSAEELVFMQCVGLEVDAFSRSIYTTSTPVHPHVTPNHPLFCLASSSNNRIQLLIWNVSCRKVNLSATLENSNQTKTTSSKYSRIPACVSPQTIPRSHIPVSPCHKSNFLYLYLPVSRIVVSFPASLSLFSSLPINCNSTFSSALSLPLPFIYFSYKILLKYTEVQQTLTTPTNLKISRNGIYSKPRHKPLLHPPHPRTIRLQRPRIRNSYKRRNHHS